MPADVCPSTSSFSDMPAFPFRFCRRLFEGGNGHPAATSCNRFPSEQLLLYRALNRVSAHYGSHVWSQLLIHFVEGDPEWWTGRNCGRWTLRSQERIPLRFCRASTGGGRSQRPPPATVPLEAEAWFLYLLVNRVSVHYCSHAWSKLLIVA